MIEKRKKSFYSSGFTIIELLVILFIIIILGIVTSSGFQKAKEVAFKTKCINNLKQISAALSMYANDNNSNFPPDAAAPNTWASRLFPQYINDESYFDCPDHAYVGTLATGPDYKYVSGLDLEDSSQTLILSCYEGAHYGYENKLNVGGNVIFEQDFTAFP